MKTKTILIGALMLLGLSAYAFAGATFTVGSIPVTTVANSGYTERTGDITFTTVAGSDAIVTGTITINYGVPITNHETGDGNIKLETYGSCPTVSVLSHSGTKVVLGLGAQDAAASCAIRMYGVRVAVADTSLTALDAYISSTGNAIVAGQTTVRVIVSIDAGIKSFTGSTPVTINAVTGGSGTVTLSLAENFFDAFGVTVATDPSQDLAQMVKISLSALPPAGITLTFPAYGYSGSTAVFTRCSSAGVPSATTLAITNTSTSKDVYYIVTTDTDLLTAETFTFAVSVAATSTPIYTTDPPITASASMALIGTATPLTQKIPRYKEVPVGAAQFYNLVGYGTSTLMIPYSVFNSTYGYDTGIAIANTTADPGPTYLYLSTGAIAQTGAMTFYFYPQSGTPFSYTTTAGSPGAGLLSNGKLAAGGTYTVMLSQLLAAAGKSGNFTGYIIVVTQFTNAHGQYFISDFEYFTNGAQILVLSSGRATSAEALDH